MNTIVKRSIVISIIGYLISSFVSWDILWITEIGKCSVYDRIIMLCAFLILHIIGHGIFFGMSLNKE